MIQILCYEEVHTWILGKFARKMHEYLGLFAIDAEIAREKIPASSVIHHISYGPAPYEKTAPVETLMITHLDTETKLHQVKRQLKSFNMGICMSGDHRSLLIRAGLPEDRLCAVPQAHDGAIKPRPIVLGIASKVHDDGRKNEWDIVKSLQQFPPGAFHLKIMGAGWERQVTALLGQGHSVEYHAVFDYEQYVNSFMPSLDYWLYFSHDEGSMAFQDAIAADAKIIATPQGFHLDVLGGIDHVINDMHDLHMTLHNIHMEQQQRVARVSRWTWAEHTWRHLVIWDYLQNMASREALAEEKVFIKFLPGLDQSIGKVLQYELVARPVPEMDALLLAAKLAEEKGLQQLAAQYRRKALVFYPKNDELRSMVLQLYPSVQNFVPA